MSIEGLFSGESENVEYKQIVPRNSSNYMKTVVAFANGSGGKLVFGVEDKTLRIIGFPKESVFQKVDDITNAIYDSCEPRITPRVAVQEIDGKAVIVVEILSGMQRPYFIKSIGVIDGTFVRVSGTSRRAEGYMLQELILQGTNRSFDQQVSEKKVSEQDISLFCDRLYENALILSADVEGKADLQRITKYQLLSWKLLAEKNGDYYATNGYLLLTGDEEMFPEATIQCALFKGKVRDIFIDRKEFKGPLYQQIEDAYNFILQHISMGSRIESLYRQDIYELPIKTIREMIVNAVCHRSYLSPGKIQVALYDDRLEVTSPGMLDNEITIEKMKSGLSKIRNKSIAATFSYMNMIEAWGSGIPRMFREAKEYGLKEPELIDMGSDFRINLYRRVLATDGQGVMDPRMTADIDTDDTIDTKTDSNDTNDTNDTKILGLIDKNPTITQVELKERLGLSIATVKRIMADMQKRGVIERKGSSRKGKWIISSSKE